MEVLFTFNVKVSAEFSSTSYLKQLEIGVDGRLTRLDVHEVAEEAGAVAHGVVASSVRTLHVPPAALEDAAVVTDQEAAG